MSNKNPIKPPAIKIKKIIVKGKRVPISIDGTSWSVFYFEFEKAKGTFNKPLHLTNPEKSNILYLYELTWDAAPIIDAKVTIDTIYLNGETVSMYSYPKKRTTPVMNLKKHNIGRSFNVEEGNTIVINFQCGLSGANHPTYSLLYKWLDPLKGTRKKGRT